MTNSYNTQDNKKVPIIFNCLGRAWLQFVQTLNDEENEKCKTSIWLFEVLSENLSHSTMG